MCDHVYLQMARRGRQEGCTAIAVLHEEAIARVGCELGRNHESSAVVCSHVVRFFVPGIALGRGRSRNKLVEENAFQASPPPPLWHNGKPPAPEPSCLHVGSLNSVLKPTTATGYKLFVVIMNLSFFNPFGCIVLDNKTASFGFDAFVCKRFQRAQNLSEITRQVKINRLCHREVDKVKALDNSTVRLAMENVRNERRGRNERVRTQPLPAEYYLPVSSAQKSRNRKQALWFWPNNNDQRASSIAVQLAFGALPIAVCLTADTPTQQRASTVIPACSTQTRRSFP